MNTENRARIRTAVATIEFALHPRTGAVVFISKTPNVPIANEIFNKARQQAAAILRSKKAAGKKIPAKVVKKGSTNLQLKLF